MKNKNKVLVIGLDGATWRLLNPWIKAGEFPWFKKVRTQWFKSTLKSTLPPLTGSAWVSFQTGVNPGKHGILDFVHYKKNGLNELVSSYDVSFPTIWEWLEKGGKKSIVVNMPITHPIKKGNFIIISSLLTPPGKQYAWPTSIYKQLKKIGYQVDLERMTFGHPEDSMKNRVKFYEQALEMAKKRAKAGLMLLKRDWDFFFLLFKSTDITQHLFFDREETLKLYQKLEEYIQQMINLAQKKYADDLIIILCSDHGFHEGEKRFFSLYRWLEKEGYLTKEDPTLYKILRFGYRTLKKISPRSVKISKIEQTRKELYDKESQEKMSSIRKKASAWPVPFGVYLNDKTLTKEIKQKLERLTFKRKKVFKKVFEKQQVYSGERLDTVPDLVFLPNTWVKIEANESQEKIWDKQIRYFAGNHYCDPDGIIAINPGKRFAIKKRKQYKIVDLFPTIAYALGQPIPPYCDGESLIVKRQKADEKLAEKKKVEIKISGEISRL